MNICVGVKSLEDINRYIKAGANEFYCGVFEEQWINKYGYLIGINRRPYRNSNFTGYSELGKAVKKAHESACKVFFTLNEHFYTDEQLELVKYNIEKAVECGVDAIIISDISLAQIIMPYNNVAIHLSTGGTVFNHLTAEFYKKQGVSRLIFPREVTVNEISLIKKSVPDLEYEVFMLNEGCINIDGFCNHLHGLNYINKDGEFCNYKYAVGCMMQYQDIDGKVDGEEIKDKELFLKKINSAASKCGDCGLCAIFYLQNCTTSLKLVGRASRPEKIISDIKLVNRMMDVGKKVDKYEEFSDYVKKKICENKESNRFHYCYYPELRRDTL